MWSLGCIIAELSTGRPIFPGVDENEMIELFDVMIGKIPDQLIQRAKRKGAFFFADGRIKKSKQSRLAKLNRDEASIEHALPKNEDPDFLNFIQKCLVLDPAERLTCEQALRHPWLTRGNARSALMENDVVL